MRHIKTVCFCFALSICWVQIISASGVDLELRPPTKNVGAIDAPLPPQMMADDLRINEIQFVGSHNSYKLAMSPFYAWLLRLIDEPAARGLEYWHSPLAEQLDLGLRKLELDVFFDPETDQFRVGHAQVIDMNSHCEWLTDCLQAIVAWSGSNPRHAPIWIGFNLKDSIIPLLPEPAPFTLAVMDRLDEVLQANLGDRIISPSEVAGRRWPTLAQARGKVLLILDEGGTKRDQYAATWQQRPMFVTVNEDHAAAAVMVINDPVQDFARIRRLVSQGFMVRTRADANTLEARSNNTLRKQRAFASGAQAISTDYYYPAVHFNTSYEVSLQPAVRCNPVSAPPACAGLAVE